MGEIADQRGLRIVCGLLLTLGIASLAAGTAALHRSFDCSTQYSGTTKDLVSALSAAIERGDAVLAHEELQRLDDVLSETYEGGLFLHLLNEAETRLNSPPQNAQTAEADVHNVSIRIRYLEPGVAR